MRKWDQIKEFMMNEDRLVGNALLDPAIMNYVSLFVVLHILVHHGPDVWHKAVLLDHIVGLIIFTNDFTTVFKDAPANNLNDILLGCGIKIGLFENREGLALEDVLADSVLQPGLDLGLLAHTCHYSLCGCLHDHRPIRIHLDLLLCEKTSL